jgi:ornithine cyclodeaminase/alanine dehydrogenase-like protein (mu-crystallin family)
MLFLKLSNPNSSQMIVSNAIPDTVKVLSSSFINTHVPMTRAIELMESAFKILSANSAYIPPRVVMTTPDNKLSVFFKPAFMNLYKRMSIKILTQLLANENVDIATIKGLVLLIDMETGQILSITDGSYLTALRTGAASGIATSHLANPDASSLAVFGCGAQGKTQLEAILAVRPIEQVFLFDICDSLAIKLATDMKATFNGNVTVNPGLSVLKQVDVICTATPSTTPLFNMSHIKQGVHINAIGSYRSDMQEIGSDIFKYARIYLDDAPACISGSGDLFIPLNSGILQESDILGEIGEMMSGSIAGRQSPTDITVFKTVGNAIQDFFVVNEAYELSLAREAEGFLD